MITKILDYFYYILCDFYRSYEKDIEDANFMSLTVLCVLISAFLINLIAIIEILLKTKFPTWIILLIAGSFMLILRYWILKDRYIVRKPFEVIKEEIEKIPLQSRKIYAILTSLVILGIFFCPMIISLLNVQ